MHLQTDPVSAASAAEKRPLDSAEMMTLVRLGKALEIMNTLNGEKAGPTAEEMAMVRAPSTSRCHYSTLACVRVVRSLKFAMRLRIASPCPA
eukprot:SAG31_NODE_1052_length_10154_cov_2.814818_3_plen_92_part_00